jgi:flagellar protein FlaI
LTSFYERTGIYPKLIPKPEKRDEYEKYRSEYTDILYPTAGILFVHLHRESKGIDNTYYVIEPKLDGKGYELYERIKYKILDHAFLKVRGKITEKELEKFFSEIVPFKESDSFFKIGAGSNISDSTRDKILYRLKRDIIGLGPLDPLLKDKTNEDIHVLGPKEVYVENKIYGMMKTNVDLGSEDDYKGWLKSMTERLGKPVSDASPIVDTSLPDGSRLNVIYSDDISLGGPTLTIRQFEETPFSIFQLVKLRTMSSKLAAYLWLCLEHNVSIAMCGETAAGKTTTLNAVTAFIPEYRKIVTIEDTLEIKPPHEDWQRLLVREREGKGNVTLFDLVIAALRCRPDNIIVGEVRGKEGFAVFQAIQTGHPTSFTFHAGNIVSFIHRFTGKPINIPEPFFGNLNVCVFQNFIRREGRELRRVTSVHEIEGYSKSVKGIVARLVFQWDPIVDTTRFLGKYNSYVLEEKIARSMGCSDPKEVYDELEKRARVIETAVRKGMVGYHEALNIIRSYQRTGLRELPFRI